MEMCSVEHKRIERQERQYKKKKIKSEIEGYNMISLLENHIANNEEDTNKMENAHNNAKLVAHVKSKNQQL